MKKIFFYLFFAIFSINANSGEYIAVEATITSVANTNGNGESFTIWVEGGTGACANSVITFPKASAGSEKVFDRAYSTALAAYMAGKKVTVHDYSGSSCSNASYIRVLN